MDARLGWLDATGKLPSVLQKPSGAVSGVQGILSSKDAYTSFRSGDKLGGVINSGSAISSFGDAAASVAANTSIVARAAPQLNVLGTTSSLASSAQRLGTALGTGDKWNTDKALNVGAATAELVTKSAAAGAGYLIAGTAGANAAATGAGAATKAAENFGAYLGDKASDNQIFKSVTDKIFHLKTYEDQAAAYDRQIAALRAARAARQ